MTEFDAYGVSFDELGLGFDGANLSQNILLSRGNKIDQATLTGGATAAGFPLTNLQNEELWKFARFSSLVSANTYVIADLGQTETIQLVALIKHNMSPVGRWRIRIAGTAADTVSDPLYDSEWVKAAPAFSGYGTLDWGVWEWGGVLPSEYVGVLNNNAWHILPSPIDGSFIRIDFDDADENEDGYIQSPRLFVSDIYQPSVNSPYGAKVVLTDKTKVKESESGVRMYGTKRVRRGLSVSFDLAITELYYELFGPYYLIGGKSQEMVAILQPTKPETFLFEAIFGNLRDISEVTHITWGRVGTDLFIDERV